jgi:aminoglycoside N3'-acetyltransferase
LDVVTAKSLADDLRALGVREGGVLVVHMSFRAVRPVEGGPAAVIEALRLAVGDTGTIVMPSWSDDDSVPFDAATTNVAGDLGITADMFRKQPGVKRSNHPHAFAARGPRAEDIVRDGFPSPPHRLESPIGRAWELDAQVLLLGVDHDADTMVHLAEVMANVPYSVEKHCTVWENGRAARVAYLENDHCCQRFTLVGDWLGGIEARGRVGAADARLARARDVVAVALEKLKADPLVFLHDEADGCEECRDARTSVRRT